MTEISNKYRAIISLGILVFLIVGGAIWVGTTASFIAKGPRFTAYDGLFLCNEINLSRTLINEVLTSIQHDHATNKVEQHMHPQLDALNPVPLLHCEFIEDRINSHENMTNKYREITK
jgi:hypothetical protein